jgi:hypothetical protein
VPSASLPGGAGAKAGADEAGKSEDVDGEDTGEVVGSAGEAARTSGTGRGFISDGGGGKK